METSSTVVDDVFDQEQCSYCGTVLWTCICIIAAFVTIMGNVITILAILLSKRLSSLLANYFVFSLAVSDLLVGCSIPYHMLFYIHPSNNSFGSNKYNCLLRFVFTSFACSSSISNLLLIATDRYVAIVYPLHYGRFMTRRSVCIMIATGWVLATTMAAVPLIWNEWRAGVSCELSHVLTHNFLAWVVCPLFGAIWTAMLLLYTRICREANGHARRMRGTAGTAHHETVHCAVSARDSKSFQVMLTILGCFTVCWLPYFVVTLHVHARKLPNIYEISFNLAMANSSMNPLIYAWKNTNFRKAFLCLLRCRSPDTHQRYITDHVPSKRGSMNGTCNPVCNVKNVDVLQMEDSDKKGVYVTSIEKQHRRTDVHRQVIHV